MAKRRTIRTIPQQRTAMPMQEPALRARNFDEVALGYSESEALTESERCLRCPEPTCVKGCPVSVDIPGFIERIGQRDFRGAYQTIVDANVLPATCGRVCPQESKCEGSCTVGDTLPPVAIGRLQRWVADQAIAQNWNAAPFIAAGGRKVAIVGAGPAGLACAADLAKAGVAVTVFEAAAQAGGVLRYGIPEFRLPQAVLDAELGNLERLGVRIQCDTRVGRDFSLSQLLDGMGFDGVFVGTGAGSAKRMDIAGESLPGVLSASELLMRSKLRGGDPAAAELPPIAGRRVAVIGGGNAAMDALRVCVRLGASKVSCLYRRSRDEAPARLEELEHAEEEGVEFHWLIAPEEILADPQGAVRGLRCVRMALGDPDESGRRRPLPLPGSAFEFEAELIVCALGFSASPIADKSARLKLTPQGFVEVNEDLATSIAGVYAGGDIVTGAATVIEAMGAGRKAARSLKAYLGIRDSGHIYTERPSGRSLFGIDPAEHNFVRIRSAPQEASSHAR